MASNDFVSWSGTYVRDKSYRLIRCGSQIELGPGASHDIELSTRRLGTTDIFRPTNP